MRIKDYPYGKITKTLKKAVEFLSRNRTKILKEHSLKNEESYCFFEYPDYLGLPKTISSRLSTDEVDWLQEEWLRSTKEWNQKYLDDECLECRTRSNCSEHSLQKRVSALENKVKALEKRLK